MVSIKSKFLYIILWNDFVSCLVELTYVGNNSITISETIIRDALINLFAALNIGSVNQKASLKQLLRVHDFFASIALKDGNTSKELVKLTRVNIIDQNTERFVLLINKVLDEDEHNVETTDDIFVNTYIEKFVRKLRDFRTVFDNIGHIDEDIVKLLNNDGELLRNVTDVTNNTFSSNNESAKSCEYWKSNARRIYRGRKTFIRNYPFMASVQFFNRFHCGGSLIKSDLVITSSSCLQLAWNNRFFRENPAFLSVRIGSVFSERGGENIPVLEVYFHPNYDPKSLRNNLAIMRLAKRIHFSKANVVKKINIDRSPTRLPDTTRGITVLGWGAKDSRNYVRSRKRLRLAYDMLHFYPLRECREVYSKAFVTREHFCGGYFSKGGGACNRDAGGPGIVNDTLMGVISFGSLYCGAVDAPTVFTKLGYYTDWIEDIMEQDVPHTYKVYQAPPKRPKHTLTTRRTHKIEPVGKSTTKLVPIKEVDLRALRTIDALKNYLSLMLSKEES